jgi:hypothetical protein
MSLYNSLFGFNSAKEILLKILNIEEETIPRFRDCFYDADRHLIVIHTRTGGGNREGYREENNALTLHDFYKYDCDDEYDCTYANFFFTIPQEFDQLKDIFSGMETITPAEKWKSLQFELEECNVKKDS